MRVEGKPVCMYQLRRTFFTDRGTIEHRKDLRGYLTKNFSWEEGRIDSKIPLTDLLNENLHM